MLIMTLVGFSMLGAFVYLPVFFEDVKGDSAVVAGVKLIPLVFGFLFSAAYAGIQMSKTGEFKGWIPVGCVLLSLGNGLLAYMDGGTNFGVVFIFLVLSGLGMGIIFPVTTTVVQNSVPIADMANALSAYTFLQTMGGAIGVAILGAVENHVQASKEDEGYSTVDAEVKALQYVFGIGAAPAIFCFFLSLFLINKKLFVGSIEKAKSLASLKAQQEADASAAASPTNGAEANGDATNANNVANGNGSSSSNGTAPTTADEEQALLLTKSTTTNHHNHNHTHQPSQQQPQQNGHSHTSSVSDLPLHATTTTATTSNSTSRPYEAVPTDVGETDADADPSS